MVTKKVNIFYIPKGHPLQFYKNFIYYYIKNIDYRPPNSLTASKRDLTFSGFALSRIVLASMIKAPLFATVSISLLTCSLTWSGMPVTSNDTGTPPLNAIPSPSTSRALTISTDSNLQQAFPGG